MKTRTDEPKVEVFYSPAYVVGYIGPGLDQAGLAALHRLTLSAAVAS